MHGKPCVLRMLNIDSKKWGAMLIALFFTNICRHFDRDRKGGQKPAANWRCLLRGSMEKR